MLPGPDTSGRNFVLISSEKLTQRLKVLISPVLSALGPCPSPLHTSFFHAPNPHTTGNILGAENLQVKEHGFKMPGVSVITYMGKESKKQWIYLYVKLIHFAIHLKLTQHCKLTIHQ